MPPDRSDDPPELIGTVVELARSFERFGLVHAFGDALAYGYWGIPRATLDIDCTLFVPQDPLDDALVALAGAGCQFDDGRARRDARERGEFQAYRRDVRIDVFLPSIPFYEEARSRRVSVEFADRSIWIWSAEVIAVFKLLFFRSKDRVDLEGLFLWGPEHFDTAFVRAQLVLMMGEEDERVLFLDGLLHEQEARPPEP